MTGRRIIPRIASTYEHHDLVLNALKPCSEALPTRTLYGLTRDAHSIMCQTLIWLRFNKRCNPSMETVSGSFKRSKAVLEFPPDRITGRTDIACPGHCGQTSIPWATREKSLLRRFKVYRNVYTGSTWPSSRTCRY